MITVVQGRSLSTFGMANLLRSTCFFAKSDVSKLVTSLRQFQMSVRLSSAARKREEKGEAFDKVRYGPLTDLPDFSYLDGRPTPLSSGQIRRRKTNIELARRMKQLTDEMSGAQERYKEKLKNEQDTRKQILEKKLRPKVQ